MVPSLGFFVPGVPVQQGSKVAGKRRDGKLYLRESAKGHKAWRRAVKEAAEAALLASDEWEAGYDGPVELSLTFYFPVISSGRYWKTTAPDLSKLVRAIEDSLTDAGVYRDDSRIVRYRDVEKVHGPITGASIRVRAIETAKEEETN
jgi:crossover junction endodeoxyribonuclease RusA